MARSSDVVTDRPDVKGIVEGFQLDERMTMSTTALVRDLPHAPYIDQMEKFETFSDCDEILKSKRFLQGSHRESAVFIGDSLIVQDGDAHFERRRMESALFTRSALEYYETETLAPHVEQVLDATAARGRGRDGIVRTDLSAFIRATMARITATVTGLDGVDTIEATDRFISSVEQLNKGVTVEWATEDHDEVIERTMRARYGLVADFYEPSAARRRELVERHRNGEIDRDELPLDLLTLLFLNWDDDWDAEFALRESTLFYVAATQTTTHAVPHVIRHLDAWVSQHPEDRDRLHDPSFLKRAAYESLRLHVPVHALLRVAADDVELKSGRAVAAGTRVACCFGPANRDRAVFGDDADEFNPHRETGSVKPWGLSFGGGPHMCIGRALVTGLSTATDGSDATAGTMGRILLGLYGAGIEMDPDEEPQYVETSHVDGYQRFPVRFTKL